MRLTYCEHCQKADVPLGNSFTVDGSVYCVDCLNQNFPDVKMLEGRDAKKQMDLTVCGFCQKDNGTEEYPLISIYPVCNECSENIKHRAFPTWVKVFLAGVLLITAVGFVWNWKYYEAYENMKLSNTEAAKGNYAKAWVFMTAAANLVPEVPEIKTLASYEKGIALLAEDKSREAYNELLKCREQLPIDYNVDVLLKQAEAGMCFDDKDYACFLDASKFILENDTTVASSWLWVASAYACLYAKNEDKNAYEQSKYHIERSLAIDDTSGHVKEYVNRIEHRLAGRTIITFDEFSKKFPNGWSPNQ